MTVLDSSIATSTATFAVHANSSKDTLFLSGKDIESYLKKLETADVKVQDIDLSSLSSAPAPASVAATPAAAPKTTASTPAQAPVQIAIGVKKEEDFSAWYTNVCGLSSTTGFLYLTKLI